MELALDWRSESLKGLFVPTKTISCVTFQSANSVALCVQALHCKVRLLGPSMESGFEESEQAEKIAMLAVLHVKEESEHAAR